MEVWTVSLSPGDPAVQEETLQQQARRVLQREILSAAAARQTGFVLPLPSSAGEHLATAASLLQELIEREFVVERPVFAHEAYWLGEGDPGARSVLVITALGMRAVAANPGAQSMRRAADGAIDARSLPLETTQALARPNGSRQARSAPRGKLGVLVSQMNTKDGATLGELCRATGWQPRSVRAALSSTLKQRGIGIETSGRGPTRRYRVQGAISD